MNQLKSFASFLLLLTSFTSSAQVIETVEYKYYVISPNSPYQIKPELMRHSPIRDDKGSYNGRTDWYISWRYQTATGAYGCQLRNISTRIQIAYILPALSEQVTDLKTIEVFNKFNDALTSHEKNHGKNGLAAAGEIDKALNKIQPQQNCRQLKRMADATANAIVQKYTQADIEYDRLTNNGMTEGAVIY
jgi:predicted secreted Zn-dependent protease